MPATILWATLIAWILLVGVAVLELMQGRRERKEDAESPSSLRRRAAAFLALFEGK